MRPRDVLLLAFLSLGLVLPACGDDDVPAPDAAAPRDAAGLDAAPPPDAGPDARGALPDAGPPPDAAISHRGAVSGVVRTDHFGWRPADPKQAVLLDRTGETVELRTPSGDVLVATFTSGAMQTDEDSGDSYSVVDFSSVATPGAYYLYLPALDVRSYDFAIGDHVYDVAGAAAMKSFYFQRCNHDKALPFASDALPGHAGIGGRWVDDACHAGDATSPAGPGSPDHGRLDLHGGWHDAGDYQKTLWGRGVGSMLWAYELTPAAWIDGQLSIPESGNGVPDLLDELAWELDFYARMQRPDGHFMTSVKGRGGTTVSPPSRSDEARVYFDATSPEGGEWSGGGVTILVATANATRALAHASLVFRAAGAVAAADRYRDAALRGWGWLESATPAGDEERELRVAAAAALFRLDPSRTAARTLVESFPWDTWNGRLPYSVTPNETTLPEAAWHYLSTPAGSDATKAVLRAALGAAIVDRAFAQAGVYGGLFGDPSNGWEWSWGSNAANAAHGANLFAAARFGALGSHTRDEVEALALRYVHYVLGLNPRNMVYLTNMAAYGGEHSSFQIYHGWFSYTGGDGDHGNADFNGRPAAVVEPLYPYHPSDTQTSTYGPAPGLVPGGPNVYYSGTYDLPDRDRPAYAYRDWSVGCDWTGSACASASWEITEPSCSYEGPVVLLLSFVMGTP